MNIKKPPTGQRTKHILPAAKPVRAPFIHHHVLPPVASPRQRDIIDTIDHGSQFDINIVENDIIKIQQAIDPSAQSLRLVEEEVDALLSTSQHQSDGLLYLRFERMRYNKLSKLQSATLRQSKLILDFLPNDHVLSERQFDDSEFSIDHFLKQCSRANAMASYIGDSKQYVSNLNQNRDIHGGIGMVTRELIQLATTMNFEDNLNNLDDDSNDSNQQLQHIALGLHVLRTQALPLIEDRIAKSHRNISIDDKVSDRLSKLEGALMIANDQNSELELKLEKLTNQLTRETRLRRECEDARYSESVEIRRSLECQMVDLRRELRAKDVVILKEEAENTNFRSRVADLEAELETTKERFGTNKRFLDSQVEEMIQTARIQKERIGLLEERLAGNITPESYNKELALLKQIISQANHNYASFSIFHNEVKSDLEAEIEEMKRKIHFANESQDNALERMAHLDDMYSSRQHKLIMHIDGQLNENDLDENSIEYVLLEELRVMKSAFELKIAQASQELAQTKQFINASKRKVTKQYTDKITALTQQIKRLTLDLAASKTDSVIKT